MSHRLPQRLMKSALEDKEFDKRARNYEADGIVDSMTQYELAATKEMLR